MFMIYDVSPERGIIRGPARKLFCMTFKEMSIVEKTFDYLYRRAFTDTMTGLSNRNAYEEKVELLKLKPRELKGLYAAVIDINGLKEINDKFGHDSGDDAIKLVGKCLSQSFDNQDFCARIGGDEFVCFLYSDASEKIDTLNQLIKLESTFVKFPLSISVGFAKYDETRDNGIDSLINRCDMLMYMKKKAKKTVNPGPFQAEDFDLNQVI